MPISRASGDLCPLWVKADLCGAIRHVRFSPRSGHLRRTTPCLLWAKSGHDRRWRKSL